jgi:hypothetical protein
MHEVKLSQFLIRLVCHNGLNFADDLIHYKQMSYCEYLGRVLCVRGMIVI